jgi:hypothetical protein
MLTSLCNGCLRLCHCKQLEIGIQAYSVCAGWFSVKPYVYEHLLLGSNKIFSFSDLQSQCCMGSLF